MGNANVRGNDLTPGYGWNETAGRYVDLSTGRFVSQSQIRTALDRTLDEAAQAIVDVTRALREGWISLADWQTQMAQDIKIIHLASGALAQGGWAQLTAQDFGRIGYELRQQYVYLRNFAYQIETGAQRLDGTLEYRARLYAQAGRGTYEELRRREMALREMTQERRVLGIADHCDDCVAYAGEGWQPIGSLPRIGDSQCVTNCHCTFDYRQRLSADAIGGFGL